MAKVYSIGAQVYERRAARYRREAIARFWNNAAVFSGMGALALVAMGAAIAFGLAIGASLSI